MNKIKKAKCVYRVTIKETSCESPQFTQETSRDSSGLDDAIARVLKGHCNEIHEPYGVLAEAIVELSLCKSSEVGEAACSKLHDLVAAACAYLEKGEAQ